jgi:hypothetical protein|nr:hypothetical protein [uncultured Acetatifactor sp.]
MAFYILAATPLLHLEILKKQKALDIDKVTEIFIRINSKGTALGQSDSVISKMALAFAYMLYLRLCEYPEEAKDLFSQYLWRHSKLKKFF